MPASPAWAAELLRLQRASGRPIRRTDLIRGAILTGADVGDSLAADALQGDEAAVYADKAYDSGARRKHWAKPGSSLR
jgi:IS5 family transposase